MNKDFVELYESLSVLNEDMLAESKQDTINFKNWLTAAGFSSEAIIDEWIQRFDNLRKSLKSPENDYYYWIKNKSVEDLLDFIIDTECERTRKKNSREAIKSGAKLIKSTAHWNIYSITNFEAAQQYGRDTTWCITGYNGEGRRYWDKYTNDGYDFYFIITKEDYDPRGEDSKFAFAIHKDGEGDIFNQVDDQVLLTDIPYYDEIEIPGVNLANFSAYCSNCGELAQDGGHAGPEDELYCDDCYAELCYKCDHCYDSFYLDEPDEAPIVVDDNHKYCPWCWNAFDGYITKLIMGVDGKENVREETILFYGEAVTFILEYIGRLSPEDRKHFYINWTDMEEYDDEYEEGDVIVSIYSLDELGDDYTSDMDRILWNEEESARKITKALGLEVSI